MYTVTPFRYVATIDASDIKPDEVSVQARAADESRAPRTAGSAPRIRFWRDRMVLIASPHEPCEIKWCAFRAGDAIVHAARAGDSLEAARNVVGGVWISLTRADRLVVAIGALLGERVGTGVSVETNGRRDRERRVEVRVGDDARHLGAREAVVLGGYDVYVDHVGLARPASLSIAATDDPIVVNSARRSAVWMGTDADDPLHGERRDGTYIRSIWTV